MYTDLRLTKGTPRAEELSFRNNRCRSAQELVSWRIVHDQGSPPRRVRYCNLFYMDITMKNAITVRAWKAFSFGFVLFCGLLLQAGNISAQPARIKHVIQTIQKDKTQYLGRDLWFTMAQNYDQNVAGKFYAVYVTSPNNTTVHIQVTGGSTAQFPIAAGEVLTYNIPLAWEVTTSGVVEAKGVRVWSNDADLTTYLLSRNPFTTDGMLVIPTTGWGTEYVVAAYASLFEGGGSFVY